MNASRDRRAMLCGLGALTAGAAATGGGRPGHGGCNRHPTPSSHSWKPTKPHGRAYSRFS
jgi:hypothetical protein